MAIIGYKVYDINSGVKITDDYYQLGNTGSGGIKESPLINLPEGDYRIEWHVNPTYPSEWSYGQRAMIDNLVITNIKETPVYLIHFTPDVLNYDLRNNQVKIYEQDNKIILFVASDSMPGLIDLVDSVFMLNAEPPIPVGDLDKWKYKSIIKEGPYELVPFIDNVDEVTDFNFDNVKPIISNQYGEIEFLDHITSSSTITGKHLSDIIAITDDVIDVDVSGFSVGFDVRAKLTFYDANIPVEHRDKLQIYDSRGNEIYPTIISYEPLSFEIERFNTN